MQYLTLDIALSARNAALRAAQQVANLARSNAYAHGGRSFWYEIGDSVQVQQTDGGAVVGATHAAAGFKHTGGTISAPGRGAGSLRRRALTIPVGPARANRWDTDAAQQAGYVLARAGDVLVGRKGKRGRPVPLFILRKSVTQRADPWWPENNEVAAIVRKAMEEEEDANG